jgi:hypothetical protein
MSGTVQTRVKKKKKKKAMTVNSEKQERNKTQILRGDLNNTSQASSAPVTQTTNETMHERRLPYHHVIVATGHAC